MEWLGPALSALAVLISLLSFLASRRDKGSEEIKELRRELELHKLDDARELLTIEKFERHEREIAEEFRRFNTTVTDLSRALWQRGRSTRANDDDDR